MTTLPHGALPSSSLLSRQVTTQFMTADGRWLHFLGQTQADGQKQEVSDNKTFQKSSFTTIIAIFIVMFLKQS